MFKPKTILFATDFSEPSQHALPIAADIAAANGSLLLVLHVAETLGSENVTVGDVSQSLQPDAYRQRLLDDLKRANDLSLWKIEIEYLISEGDPQRKIVEFANARSCDLIVVGKNSRSGIRRLLLGSTAEYVARHATCSVLIAREVVTTNE